MTARRYVVAPAAPGFRGTAIWTVTDDGQLGEMVATEPQDHGPGSTAVPDLADALAVYRAACAALAPDEATVERVARAIDDPGYYLDEWTGIHGTHEEQARAVLAALAALAEEPAP